MSELPKHVPWWAYSITVVVAVSFGTYIFYVSQGLQAKFDDMNTHIAVIENDTGWIKQQLSAKFTVMSTQ